jgi:hypothetical protein
MYQIILMPLAAAFVSQLSKFFIASNNLRPSLRNIVAYSGMPSGHSAMVISLVTIIGLIEGIDTPFFAIAFVLAVLVIRDAVGLRRYLGEHGRIINGLVKELGSEHLLDKEYPRLLEKIGHTPAQVMVGSLIGFFVSLIGFFVLN